MITFECEAVLFDLDGVLVDSTRAVERVWRAWAKHHGLDAARVVAVAHGRRTIETVRLFAPHLDPEAETKKLEQAEIEDTVGLRRADGAAAMLAALPSGSWAVVTSGTRSLATSRLRHTGLLIPQVLVGAEDIEKGKPDPECYLKGSQLIGASAERCVVVEDTAAGVQAARSADMTTIAVTTTHRASELSDADALVRTLTDVHVEVRHVAGSGEARLELLVENQAHENGR
ncbi:MAG TPA: HAD-IA family hydrolase [Rubrobacteraceae bacterium]|jgi:sugar-phosphatase|nr:HAD-IA family hydrolase [Rubrobacteraceae bacterium]